MLFQLGTVTFEVFPVNVTGHDRDTGADFAAKDIMGGMRSLEFTGEGDETRSFDGVIFPDKFGGLSTLDELDNLRKSGNGQILVRGDGKNLGWWVIEKVREKSTFLARDGVGKQIDFSISLRKSPKPSPAQYLRTLLRLFA